MLLEFENRLEQQSSIDQISTMTANYASSSNNRGGGRKYNGSRGQSYTSYTSNASNYNYKGRGREGRYTQNGRHNSISSEKPQYQLCGKFGHTVHVCYHRFDISYQNSSNSGTNSLNMNIRNQNNISDMVASSNNLADGNWYLDSGASYHLTQNVENLTNSTPYTGTNKVTVGNGKHLSISNTGSHHSFSNSRSFQLRKVFHVPFILANLISVAKFCSDNNALIEF